MFEKNTKDVAFLENCVNLGRKAAKFSFPNPGVGCLIVKNNKIISYGYTANRGRPHAEQIAIKKIQNQKILHGATIYVSLEPCFHKGQTEPCVDLIISNKFSRVVIAAIDPDQRVSTKSISKLKDNNIEVEVIPIESAKNLYRSYFKNRIKNLPYVTAKIASSADNKTSYIDSNQQWITTSDSRRNGHFLRFDNEAILIGKNTLTKDNPGLDCRIPGLEKYSPVIVVITSKIDFDCNLEIFNNSQKKIILYCNSDENRKKSQILLRDPKTKMIAIESEENKINLNLCLEVLYQEGIGKLLIEGGLKTIRDFLAEDLIDELYWYKSNKNLADKGANEIKEEIKLNRVKKLKINEHDSLTIFQKND